MSFFSCTPKSPHIPPRCVAMVSLESTPAWLQDAPNIYEKKGLLRWPCVCPKKVLTWPSTTSLTPPRGSTPVIYIENTFQNSPNKTRHGPPMSSTLRQHLKSRARPSIYGARHFVNGFVHSSMGSSIRQWVRQFVSGFVNSSMGSSIRQWVRQFVNGFVNGFVNIDELFPAY